MFLIISCPYLFFKYMSLFHKNTNPHTFRVCFNTVRPPSSRRSESSYMSSVGTHRSDKTNSTVDGGSFHHSTMMHQYSGSQWDYAPRHTFTFLYPSHDQYRRAWDTLALETSARRHLSLESHDRRAPAQSREKSKGKRHKAQ